MCVHTSSARCNELLDMPHLFLLLPVKLELIGILLLPGTNVGGVISSPVLEPFLLHDHSICTNAIKEILGVRDDNKDLVIAR